MSDCHCCMGGYGGNPAPSNCLRAEIEHREEIIRSRDARCDRLEVKIKQLKALNEGNARRAQDYFEECQRLQQWERLARCNLVDEGKLLICKAEDEIEQLLVSHNLLRDAISWFEAHEVHSKLGHVPQWFASARALQVQARNNALSAARMRARPPDVEY